MDQNQQTKLYAFILGFASGAICLAAALISVIHLTHQK
jgi:hypothetical protein